MAVGNRLNNQEGRMASNESDIWTGKLYCIIILLGRRGVGNGGGGEGKVQNLPAPVMKESNSEV